MDCSTPGFPICHSLLELAQIHVHWVDDAIWNLLVIAQLVKNLRNAGEPGLIPRSRRSAGEGIDNPPQYPWASLVAQLIKCLPAMRGTWVQSLGWEDALEKGKSYPLQYSGLENPMGCMVPGVTKSQTLLSDCRFHFNCFKGAGV